VTLEPCPMCASALIHARVARVVFGARDPKGGACGSVFQLLPPDQRFNHRLECQGDILAQECGDLLRHFFRQRRDPAVQDDGQPEPSLNKGIREVDMARASP
ncbi:MAG: nucleoside deaminase, partial [Chromatiaceae bacterium]